MESLRLYDPFKRNFSLSYDAYHTSSQSFVWLKSEAGTTFVKAKIWSSILTAEQKQLFLIFLRIFRRKETDLEAKFNDVQRMPSRENFLFCKIVIDLLNGPVAFLRPELYDVSTSLFPYSYGPVKSCIFPVTHILWVRYGTGLEPHGTVRD